MTVWWRAVILLCCILCCVDSLASVLQSITYKNSFRLAKSTRKHVQRLLENYKEQHLGNKHFEDRSRQLKDLPLLSTDFYSWLTLTDWERLHSAFWDMQIYWNMLQWKRKQLEKEEKEQMVGRVAHFTLLRDIKHIQLDLRDLMSQVSNQMRHIKDSWTKPAPPPEWSPHNAEASFKTVWDSRVEGYVILRDLDLYLTKLARDFLLLASKAHS